MIRFAVIGTNWISHAFCEAAQSTGRMQLCAVYSRTLDTAQAFAKTYNVQYCYTELDALAKSPDIDAVYIASPNALHAEQAMLMMHHGKHVLIEKPMASNKREVAALIACAKQHNVVLFEAMKSWYCPNFEILQQALDRIGPLHRATFSFCQYSSRYQAYLDGKNPNTFNPEFSNGSLMDIGVYPISLAIALFGEPSNMLATGSLLASGVDAHGSITLQYGGFEVINIHSKVSQGSALSEIQGEQGTITIDAVSKLHTLTLQLSGQPSEVISVTQPDNAMGYEATAFAGLIEQKQVQHGGLERTLLVSKIITQARKQLGIHFPADDGLSC